MSKTKIVVIQRKELIYTGIFVGLGILLICLLIFMFRPASKTDTASQTTTSYKPGVYTTELSLNDTLLNIEVVVDENHVNSVSFSNIDESVSAMYPLLEPTLSDIESQLCNNVDISEISTSENNKYTQTLLLDAIQETLEKAEK